MVKYICSVCILAVCSFNAWAGCDETSAQCLVFIDGLEYTESCRVSICANTSEYQADVILENGGSVTIRLDSQSQNISIDKHEGTLVPLTILKENLTCYVASEIGTTYCVKDVLL